MKIDLSKATKMQTLKGWGTSACWWSQYCKDEETAKQITDLLYGDDGLKLNIYRYNIGGGTDPDNCRVANPWRKTESLYTFDREAETGEYNFDLDATARHVMDLCLATGNVDTLILFANSPHYSHTSTGQASGSLLMHTCNIPKMNYGKFVDYILTVTQHFLDMGLPVKYISPINEPQWKWGGSYVWQEGCHYEVEELVEIFHLFAQEIIKRDMPVKLYGPESGEMFGETMKYLEALFADETIMQVLDVFAYHSYHNDNDVKIRTDFKKQFVDAYPDMRFDMSEWCELPNKSHTKSFKGALITARIIGQDLIYAGAESWTSWVAVNNFAFHDDGFDYSDALITADFDFSEWYVAKRYYGFAHFSKYIPVGSKCLDIGFYPDESNDFNLFAFETPQGKTVLVAVNEGSNREFEIGGNFAHMQIIESTQDSSLETTYNGTFKTKITSKSSSLLTIILE